MCSLVKPKQKKIDGKEEITEDHGKERRLRQKLV